MQRFENVELIDKRSPEDADIMFMEDTPGSTNQLKMKVDDCPRMMFSLDPVN